MPAATRLNKDSRPSWDDVLRALSLLPVQPQTASVTLEVDPDVWLIAFFVPEQGYWVTGPARGDRENFTLVDPNLDSEPVRVWCAGETMTRPRQVFVGEWLARKAFQHFFETGERDPSLTWKPDDTLWCD